MRPSIRVTLTGLITLCIALTAFVSMYMTITSGDAALDDVKEVRDSSVGSLFNTSEVELRKAGRVLIEKISEGAAEKVTEYFQVYEVMAGRNVELMEMPDGEPFSGGDDYMRKAWELVPQWASEINRYKHDGLMNIGASWLPVSGVDLITTVHNTSDVSLEYNDDPTRQHFYRRGVDLSDVGTLRYQPMSTFTPPACPVLRPLTYKKTWCTHPLTRVPEETAGILSLTPPGRSNVQWLRIYAGLGYMVTVVHGTWRNEHGTTSGNFFNSISVGRVSNFLATIETGTPRGRIFTVIRSDWMGFGSTEQLGWLTGASHGRAEWWFDDTEHPHYNPYGGRQADWATDDVIRTAGEWVRDYNSTTTVSGYEALLQGGDVVEVSLNTSWNGTGTGTGTTGTGSAGVGNESFYLNVGELKPGRGFDWYIVTLIDREFIMGEIDRALVTIRDEIDESSQKADDDLEAARLILYVTVAVIVVCLVAASVALVYFITYPLLVLQVEMGYVACMKLEEVDVDRPPSFLREVRHMQWSFVQMIRNIKEYRNFMPASVLCEETDEDEGSEMTTSRRKSSSLSILNSRKELKAAVVKLQVGSLTLKDTGILVLNKRGSLRDSSFLSLHAQYIDSVVMLCTESGGIPESFYGDTVYMTWNAVRPLAQYYVQMCKCSQLLKSNVSMASIGMVSQRMKVGNMGCSNMRRFSYIGYGFPAALLVEKLNKVYESQVLGAGLSDGVKQNFLTKIVDRVTLPKLTEKPVVLLEIMEVGSAVTSRHTGEEGVGRGVDVPAGAGGGERPFCGLQQGGWAVSVWGLRGGGGGVAADAAGGGGAAGSEHV